MEHRQEYIYVEGGYRKSTINTMQVPDTPLFAVIKSPVIKTELDSDGWRPMTPYSVKVGRDFSHVAYIGRFATRLDFRDYYVENYTDNVPGFYIPMSDTSQPSLANVKNAALGKLKGQQLNVIMLLKERKETLTGIHDRLKWLLTSVNAARKGDLIKSARSLRRFWRSRTPGVVNRYKAANDKVGKPLANMWLELQFLHMQVMADTDGLMSELTAKPKVGFVHGRSGLENEVSDFVYDKGRYTWSGWGDFKFKRTIKSVSYAQISAMPDLEFLTSFSRLGITNPLYVLWDSVPLSFVADWVIPIGKYLNAWDALVGMKFKGAHVGTIKQQTVEFISHTHPDKGGSVLETGTVSIQNPRVFSRELTDWMPDLPQVRNPLSGLAWKVATTAALLSGAVGKSQSNRR